MKTRKTILGLSIFVLTLLSQTNVKATMPIPGPTPPPDKASDIRKNVDPRPKEIFVYCPDKISVAPVNLPPDWVSVVPVPRYRQSISVEVAKKAVVCWYGVPGDTNFFLSNLISHGFPEGYECQIDSSNAIYATCTKRTLITR